MEKDINFQVRQIAYNVYCFFKNRPTESIAHKPDDVYLTQLVAKVTGLSIITVSRIIEEGNLSKAEDGEAFVTKRPKVQLQPSSTSARKKNKPLNKQHIDEQTKGIIRRKVIRFYTEMNELPTVQKLNTLLRKEQIIKSVNNDHLIQLLLKLGFKFPDDLDAEIEERPDIALERIKFLQRLKMFRKSNTNIFFLSETIFWHLKNAPIEETLPNIIVVHVSGPNDFIDGEMLKMRPRTPVDEAFMSGNKNAIAAYHFADYTWVKDNVIPYLEPKSLIVIDSPLYEKGPDNQAEPPPITCRYTMTALKVWLERNNIPYIDSAKRTSLVNTIKSVLARRDLAISKLLVQSGFSVIHLPQTHNDLNPIRMVWESIDSEGTSEDESALSLLQKYPTEKWQEWFQDIKALEDEYYKHDMEMDDAVDDIKMKIKKEKMDPEEISEEPEEKTEEPDGIMDEIKEEPTEYEIVIEGMDLFIKSEPGTSD